MTNFVQTNIIKMSYYRKTHIGVCEVHGYITGQEAAEKWGITERQVQILCKANRIVGATRMSRIWIIPENAEKPTHKKITQGGRKE